jgi:hypothetical protein
MKAATPHTPVRCSVCQASAADRPLLRCAYHAPTTQATCATPVCAAHAARRSPTVGYCEVHAWMGSLPVLAPCARCGMRVSVRRWHAGLGESPGRWEASVPPVNPVTGTAHAPRCIGCDRERPLLDENAQT